MAAWFVFVALIATAAAAPQYIFGLQGESCAATCGRQGLSCIPSVPTNNSADIFKKLGISCKANPMAWWAEDQPSVVVDPADPNYGECLGYMNVPSNVLCQGAFHSVRRVCYCGESVTGLPFFGTGYSGGMITTNETTIFAHVVEPGSYGVMDHLWTTLPAHGLDNAIFRYYLDGETTASIEFRPGLACGVGFGDDTAPWGIKWFGVGAGNGQGPAYTFNFNIPFQRSVRFTVQHTTSNLGGFYVIVRGMKNKRIQIGDVTLPSNARLQLQKFEGTVDPMEFVTVTNVTKGAGMHFMSTLAVTSGNLNFLEGCYRAYTPPSTTFPGIVLSTGTEDYFDSAWYFNAGEFRLPVSGFTHLKSNSSYVEWSAYRFHEMDPLTFTDGFQFVWRNGDMLDKHTGLKCYTQSDGAPAGAPTRSHVISYGWVYTW
eukprot:m.90857 g.90857  ORF g.90857 m.90857 type:complete len:428 (-) comp13709_c0_seq2:45-1328(-)